MEDDGPSIGTTIGLIFAVIGTFAVIGIALWGFDVFTSGVRGHANVIKQNNDANNQIQAQDAFNKLWGEIQGYKADIKSDAAQVTEDAVEGRDAAYDKSVLAAVQSTCRDAVGRYNAYTTDTTMKEWRPAQDPDHIALTDCEVQK